MNKLINITLDKELRKNPNAIANAIATLAEDIETCKGDLTKIKHRSIFKKIFKNNIRDLADAMIKQNDTISTFLNIIQSLIFINVNNIIMLGGIMEKLKMHEKARGLSGNKYINLAKEYLIESISAAQKTNKKLIDNESNIIDIKNKIIEKNKLDEEQSRLINKLERDLSRKNNLDDDQTQKIKQLFSAISDKERIDKSQNVKINEIVGILKEKDALDKTQSEEIKLINGQIKINYNKIKELEKFFKLKLSTLVVYTKKQNNRNVFIYIALILDFVLIIGTLLKILIF